jgi:hypothetical protein
VKGQNEKVDQSGVFHRWTSRVVCESSQSRPHCERGLRGNPAGTAANQITGWTFLTNYGGAPTASTVGGPAYSFVANNTSANAPFNIPGYAINGNFLYLNDNPGPEPAVSQSVKVAPNTSYLLTGNYRSVILNQYAAPFHVEVSDINGIVATGNFAPTGTVPSDPWGSFSVPFTTNGSTSSITVTLVSQFGGDNDYGVDNVSLATAVPEPSTLALLGLGIAGTAGYRRRQRKLAAA